MRRRAWCRRSCSRWWRTPACRRSRGLFLICRWISNYVNFFVFFNFNCRLTNSIRPRISFPFLRHETFGHDENSSFRFPYAFNFYFLAFRYIHRQCLLCGGRFFTCKKKLSSGGVRRWESFLFFQEEKFLFFLMTSQFSKGIYAKLFFLKSSKNISLWGRILYIFLFLFFFF